MKFAIKLNDVPASLSVSGILSIFASKDKFYVKAGLQLMDAPQNEAEKIELQASKEFPVDVFFEGVSKDFLEQYKNNIKILIDDKEIEARFFSVTDAKENIEECPLDVEMDCLFSTENYSDRKPDSANLIELEETINLTLENPAPNADQATATTTDTLNSSSTNQIYDILRQANNSTFDPVIDGYQVKTSSAEPKEEKIKKEKAKKDETNSSPFSHFKIPTLPKDLLLFGGAALLGAVILGLAAKGSATPQNNMKI